MSTTVSVQLDAVQALGGELAELADRLAGDGPLCRSTAASLEAALAGSEGWAASVAATAWAGLVDVVASRCAAVAATLLAAVDAYRAADVALAGRMGHTWPLGVPVGR